MYFDVYSQTNKTTTVKLH